MGATLILGVLCGVAALIALPACSETGLTPTSYVPGGGETLDSARHPDAAALVALGEEVARRAEEEALDPVLRQVNVNPNLGSTNFLFTDAAATKEVSVTVPERSAPESWSIRLGGIYFLGHPSPGMDLSSLRIGPAKVVKAAAQHWNGCPVRGLTLTGKEGQLVWYIFCNLPEGVVSGTMDGVTGEFVPSLAPPAIVPPTATKVK